MLFCKQGVMPFKKVTVHKQNLQQVWQWRKPSGNWSVSFRRKWWCQSGNSECQGGNRWCQSPERRSRCRPARHALLSSPQHRASGAICGFRIFRNMKEIQVFKFFLLVVVCTLKQLTALVTCQLLCLKPRTTSQSQGATCQAQTSVVLRVSSIIYKNRLLL